MRARWGGALAAALAFLAPGTAEARQAGPRMAPGAAVEIYRFSDAEAVGLESVTLVTTPFAAGLAGERVSAALSGAWASGTVRRSGSPDARLSGLVDTQLRVDWAVVQDQLTFTVRGFLPTGRASLDAAESVVAGIVSSDLLPFRISNWGTGGGVLVEGAASRRLGSVGAGVAIGWGRSGEFEPVAGDDAVYRPGNQLSARVAVETELGRGARGSLRLGVRRHAEDRLEGRNLFRPGDRAEALATVGFPTPRGGSASVYAGWLRRGEGTALLDHLSGAPAQDLLLVGGLWRVALGRGWVQPRADLRLFRSGDGVGQGYHLGVGASAELRMGSRLTLVPVAIGRIGTVDVRRGEKSRFTGAELGLSLRLGR